MRKNSISTEYALTIAVHPKDEYIYYLFKKYVKSNLNLRRVNYDGCDSIRFSLYGREFINNIVNHNILPNKTYKEMNIPEMDEILIPHFIRGYFDGDGTCVVNVVKDRFKQSIQEYTYRIKSTFRIFSKMGNILTEIHQYLKLQNIETQFAYFKEKDGYTLQKSDRLELIKLYKLLYNNAEFYFERKRKSFLSATLSDKEFIDKNPDLIKDRNLRDSNYNKSKLVLDLETGIYYDSIRSAGKSKNINPTKLKGWLDNEFKNKSNLVYC